MIKSKSNPDAQLPLALGPSLHFWSDLVDAISTEFSPVTRLWKPTRLEFGWVCLLKQKDRTLVYLIPGQQQFEASIVLGNRAASLALAGELSAQTKKLISEARVYAEGRGVRFFVRSSADVLTVLKLVRFKLTPK